MYVCMYVCIRCAEAKTQGATPPWNDAPQQGGLNRYEFGFSLNGTAFRGRRIHVETRICPSDFLFFGTLCKDTNPQSG
jgi:hypothetical protein